MKTLGLLALGFATMAGGCVTSESVVLRNSAGMTVRCGPYTDFGYGNLPSANITTQMKVRDCVSDYQRQGYERAPG